jgi:prepilin-type processing-associated H-X9-DG protein
LLLGALGRAKAKAQQARCVNNLHQLGVGLQQFLANNHGYPSAYAGKNDDYPGTWISQLARDGLGVSKPDSNYIRSGIWLCPSAQWSKMITELKINPLYYSYNAFGVMMPGNRTNGLGLFGHYSETSHTIARIQESEVINPVDMMALGDDFDAAAFFMRFDLKGLEAYGNVRSRHRGRANVLLCDAHVESPTLGLIFEDTADSALARWNRDHQPHREFLAP